MPYWDLSTQVLANIALDADIGEIRIRNNGDDADNLEVTVYLMLGKLTSQPALNLPTELDIKQFIRYTGTPEKPDKLILKIKFGVLKQIILAAVMDGLIDPARAGLFNSNAINTYIALMGVVAEMLELLRQGKVKIPDIITPLGDSVTVILPEDVDDIITNPN